MKIGTNTSRLLAQAAFFCALSLSQNSAFAQCDPPPIVTILPASPGFCPGGSVVLTAEVEGATAFLWSNGAVTESITASLPGSYSVTVTTTPNCSSSATVSVTAFPAPGIASISVFDNSGIFNDNKICHGSEVVLAANQTGTGTPPFSYQFTTAPTGFVSFIDANTSFTNSTWTNTTGSPVTVALTNTITDANGCTGSLTIDVMANCQQGLTIERSENSGTPNDGGICFGDACTFLSHPTGGTGVNSYTWSGNAQTWTTANITDAPPANNANTLYFLTVTDDAGCTVQSLSSAKGITEVAITALPLLVCPPSQQAISINVAGGVPTPSGYLGRVNLPWGQFNFYHTPPAVVQNIGQPPGSTVSYHIFMKDEKGCADSVDLEVTVPTGLGVDAGADAEVCFGNSTELDAVTMGGSGNMTFSWSPTTGLDNPNIANPVATPFSTTNYTVVAIDALGCTSSDAVQITVLPAPEPGISPANPVISCANPTVVLTATTATGWFWSTGETMQSISVSATGTYSVTITGANGCTAIGSRTVTGNSTPPNATISPASALLTCTSPTANLTASGGGTYLWSNGATTAAITVSTPGTYVVTVTGANGCTLTAGAVVTESMGGGTAAITPSSFVLNCTNTTVVLSASGGGSYLWSNGSTWYQITVGVAGTYSCTVTNPGGCTAVATATITSNYLTYYWDQDLDGYGVSTQTQQNCPQWVGAHWVLQAGDCAPKNPTVYPGAPEICDGLDNDCDGLPETPTVASISPASVTLTCLNPSSTLTASGGSGSGYTFFWSNGATTASINASSSGTYAVTVTGQAGCTSVATRYVGANFSTPTASVSPATATLSCGNPTVVLTAGGGGTYLWANGSTSPTRTVSAAGTYSVTVTGTNGCTATASAMVLGNAGPPIALISATNNVLTCSNTTSVLTATGGGSYLWSNGSTYSQITVGVAATYSVTVSTGAGCTATASKNITASYQTYYYDQDGDGYGVAGLTQQNCPQWVGPGWSLQAGDCSPNNPTAYPGAPEICDGIDNDCDGLVDETTLNVAVASSTVNCFGQNSTLTATGSGGVPPYQYNFDWGGWQSPNSKTVSAGTHTVAIRDALGCIKQAGITQITQLVITNVSVAPQGSKFKITVTVAGGTPNYKYRLMQGSVVKIDWQSDGTSHVFTPNVNAGSYTVIVKDSKECAPFASAPVTCGGNPLGGGGDRVTVDQFAARREGDFAQLQWLTETEPDDAFYQIDRATDGSSFSKILEKTPNGSRTGAQSYGILDESPVAGDNFYRLTIVSKSGGSRQSSIKKLDFSALDALLWIYPNPVDGEFFVRPRNLAGSSAVLVLTDVLGRERRRMVLGEMPDGPVSVSVKDLPDGPYFLSFQTDESRLISRQIMVLHR